VLGVLRRPQNDGDRTFLSGPDDPFVRGAGVFVDYVRLARVLGTASFYVVPVRDMAGFPHRPLYCYTLDRHQIDRDLAPLPPRQRRTYGRHLHRLVREQLEFVHHKARPGVWLFSQSASGGGGAAYTTAELRHGAPLGAEWSDGHPVTVSGLVPDGVASITAIYKARTTRLGGHRVHAPAQTVTASVVGNVVAFTLHRPGELSEPDLTQWRDAAGAVIRQIKNPR
jgi:hypothetical protein